MHVFHECVKVVFVHVWIRSCLVSVEEALRSVDTITTDYSGSPVLT